MKRRPWPLVLLAVFQLFSPIVSLYMSSISNRVSFGVMAKALWNYGGAFDRFNFFFVPVIIGLLIFFTKRIGLILVCISITFDVINNLLEWRATPTWTSLAIVLGANSVNLGLLAFLLLPRVRKVFWQAEMRWWELAPRYILNVQAEVSAEGESQKTKANLADFSSAGASLELAHPHLKKGNIIDVRFEYDGMPYVFKAEIVYVRSLYDGRSKFGVRHAETEDMLRLNEKLKHKHLPITRVNTDWKTDFWDWLKIAVKSPKAWLPESEEDKNKKK